MQVGDPAPDFALPGTGDGIVSLARFRGRKVVLYFYPKDDTPACTREALAFHALAEGFAAADTVLLGVSACPLESHRRFGARHGLAFPLLSDPDRTVLDAYGVWVEKSLYGRRFMGIARTTLLIGRDGRIARIWPQVRVAGHAEAVLEAARTLP